MMRKGALAVLMAAALFGASSPLIKGWFSDLSPVLLAGLLNMGSGGGLALWRLGGRLVRPTVSRSWSRKDLAWFAGAIVAGGVVAPVCLMFGLARSTGSAASLLLNSEAGFTALLAWLFFREKMSARLWLGLGAISCGGALAGWSQEPGTGLPLGGLAVAGACFMWGLDNNFTRRISHAEPTQITAWKGVCAGLFNLVLAGALGHRCPEWPRVAAVLTLGFFSYGISLTLFVRGLRALGAGRTAAYFATAPFMGAALSVLLLHEPLTSWLIAAAASMVVGVWLLLSENRE